MSKYNPKKIEAKWQKHWLTKKVFVAKDNAKEEKKFVLVEFPYPSGTGLHMGHLRPYTAGDIISKYHKMNGKNVVYPIGWDAFGLPAENFAIKNKVHPEISTKKNVANAKKQLQGWGIGFDWSREINTTDPKYYKWTQKIFLEFLKAGLAYEKTGLINWCPVDKTGLANEEVIDGKCERCGAIVEKKELRQWYLKITDYAEKLLDGLKYLPEWPEAIKLQQENWIGKSEGAEISFEVRGASLEKKKIKVFTTRPDTIFGATYLVLAPEHPLISRLNIDNKKETEKYIEDTKNKSDIDRTAEGKEKTGIEIKGVKAINPANNEEIPIWIADYVLGSYGTGAIMAVPAHDERDFAFAKKFNLERKEVVIRLIGKPLPDLNRRDVVKAVIIKNGKILLVNEGYYTLPGGKYEENETDYDTVIREVEEETGYQNGTVKTYLGSSESIYPKDDINRARRVKAYAVEVDEDQKIEASDGHIKSSEWFPINEGIELIKKGGTKSEHEFILRAQNNTEELFGEEGILINSDKFSGLTSEDAKKKITEFVGGKLVTKYKLRDWVFSRQRYWGEPIPVIHCEKCGVVPVPDKDLPVVLPKVKNYEPTGTGESPLAGIEKWVNTKCPNCEVEKNKTKYLIFDFDGVLGDTYKQSLQARVDMGNSKDMEESHKNLHEYFSATPWHANELDEKGKKEYHNFGIGYAEAMTKLKYNLFDDFIKEINKIKNTKIAVVSSGYDLYSKGPLKKSKLKYTHFLAGNHHHSKVEKIKTICKAWKTDIKNVYYFTDTQADVYELENTLDKRKLVGCSWGYQGEEKLKEVLSENQILKKFTDIHKIFEPGIAKRETNTMPQWAGSSWYWLRYCDPKNTKEFADKKKLKYWTPVDLYFGGMEHTTLHLLYSRFWNQFLFDRGLVTTKEPYVKRVPHGIILGPDGEKMSKSRGNVINPDDIVKVYGVDTMRLYMAFLGPHGNQIAWNDKGIIGTRRFIERVFALTDFLSKDEPREVTTAINKAVKKVSEDIENSAFNTVVSALMICLNSIYENKKITKKSFEKFLQILAPLAPHITEELWNNIGNKKSIFLSKWPTVDEKFLIEDVSIAIQINGKAREVIMLPKDTSEDEMIEKAKSFGSISERLVGKEIIKTIAVKNRIVNFVVKE